MNSKTLKIILAFILIFIIISLSGVLVYVLSGHSFYWGGFNNKKELLVNEEYLASDVEKINVNTKEADIKFIPKAIDKIVVRIYGNNKSEAKVNLDNNTLNVDYNTSFVCFAFCFESSYVEIEIPEEYIGDVNVNSVSGEITLPSIKSQNVKLKTISGDIDLGSVGDYGKVEVETTSGDITIAGADHLIAKTISGEVKVASITSSLDIITTSGDILVDDVFLVTDSKIKSTSGDVRIRKINDVYVEAKTTSGDIDISNNNRMSGIVLTITTVSGDVEVG